MQRSLDVSMHSPYADGSADVRQYIWITLLTGLYVKRVNAYAKRDMHCNVFTRGSAANEAHHVDPKGPVKKRKIEQETYNNSIPIVCALALAAHGITHDPD